jgi:hypothetical protein
MRRSGEFYRLEDYMGRLLHEDNRMMQAIEVTPFAEQADYVSRPQVVSTDTDPATVSEIYPRPSQADGYRLNCAFVDPNPNTGQIYPGFQVTPPEMEGVGD